jgi:hypothetical protein
VPTGVKLKHTHTQVPEQEGLWPKLGDRSATGKG